MKYKFGDIAINSTIKKKPEDSDRFHYIGLEHLDSGNLFVQRYGADVAPVGEKLVMKKGDILFGKRRAYQKKVAIAPFDGIFSAHGMVLRPNETVVHKEYLPFFISSDYFLNEAIRISVGSLSPTINWRDLKELEFDLPPIEEQERLAELLWAAYDLKESYKKLIAATDEMVKAEFIKINTEAHLNNSKEKTIAEISESVFAGGDKPKDYSDIQTSVYQYPVYSNGEINDGLLCFSKNYRVAEKALTVSARGNIGYVCIRAPFFTPVVRLLTIIPKKDVNITYLKYTLNHHTFSSTGSSQGQLTLPNFKKVKFYIPSLQEQSLFDTFAQQADKSKSELQQSIEHIDKVMKSLLP